MLLKKSLCAMTLVPLLSFSAHAAPTQVSGFVTLGATYTDSDQLAFRSDVSIDDGKAEGIDFGSLSRLGIQLDKQFNEHWQATGQFVLKRHVDYSFDQLTQLAFISYSPSPNWRIKIGRTGLDLFMMTPYRNIGYAYTETHAPVEFYGLVPHQNIDGAELSTTHATANGTITTRWYVGRSKDFLSNFEYEWELVLDDIMGLTLAYEYDSWLFRLNHSRAEIGGEEIDHYAELSQAVQRIPKAIWPQAISLVEDVTAVGSKISYSTLGAKYDNGEYYTQSEIAYIDASTDVLNDLTNGYIHFGKRWDQYSAQLGYSFTEGNEFETPAPVVSNPLLNQLFVALDRGFNYYVNDQSTVSLSGRYDFRPDMAMKLQFDYVNLKRDDNQFMLRLQSNADKEKLWVISATLDWVF
ncbi:hypothetical protein V1358_13770 [Pseudoalteromonas sp. YIC-656]|uniref:hypothetical protein n=1 Tax=Pseudoalteromonas pernae TaxID=3118054 RepID=UPI003241BF2F